MTKLTTALTKLGFTTTEQQEALIENLYFAGYFTREKLDKDLAALDISAKIGNSTLGKTLALAHIAETFTRAEFAKDNGTKSLDTRRVLAELCPEENSNIDQQDVEDMVLFWCQNAFDRKFGEERYQLTQTKWMEVNKDRYLQNAQTLGLVSATSPSQPTYDETWIQGASRPRAIARLQYTKGLIDSGQVTNPGNISLLAGNRELWAEIDGNGSNEAEKVEDGIRYMIDLANKNGIQLGNPPFKKYDTDVKAEGRFKNRTYLNYAEGETRKVTEAMMCEDLCHNIFSQVTVTNSTTVEPYHYRPTTFTTSKEAALNLVSRITPQQDSATILNIAEQPYTERMRTAVQTIFEAEQHKVPHCLLRANSAGNAAVAGVEGLHSELGALASEKHKAMIQREGGEATRKRPMDYILFQTRDARIAEKQQASAQGRA